MEEYIENPYDHDEEKFVTEAEKLEEAIFLGFRKMAGIDVEKINCDYDIDFEEKYGDVIKKYKEINLITDTAKGYALTHAGALVSNTILAEFIE